MAQQETQRPNKEFRAGTMTASVWSKTTIVNGKGVVQHNVRIQKRYCDERTGQWKTTTYFRSEDLPKLALVASKAYEFVVLKESPRDVDVNTDSERRHSDSRGR